MKICLASLALNFLSCLIMTKDVSAGQPRSLTGAAGILTSNISPAPRICLATNLYDFGKAKRGDTIKYDFIFTNTGDSLLAISNAKSSCDCTSVGLWSPAVPPGETGRLPVELNTAIANGNVDVIIWVESNDPRQPELFLKLKGKIANVITSNPPYALFVLSGDSGAGMVKTLDITNGTALPMTLSSPKIDNTNFTAEVKEIMPGWDYHLLVRLISPSVLHEQAIISMETSSPVQPHIAVSAIALRPGH